METNEKKKKKERRGKKESHLRTSREITSLQDEKKKKVKREWKGCIKGNTVESESCHQNLKKK